MESTAAVEMEPVLEDEIMEYGVKTVPITFPGVKAELSEESASDCELTHIKEEPESDTVSDSEGASFDLKLVKREFCEGETIEDEPEDGRAHTPDGRQDMCSKVEIEDNSILEDSSGYRLSPGFGGLRVRRKVAGSSVEAADNSEPDIEIPVQKESYKCHVCNMSFSRAVHLFLHTRKSHPGAKSFICQHCTKCFTHRSDLKIHIRTHTGEKPFSCEHCNKCFGRSSALIAHRRTHTGEKPFSCEHCNKCFAHASVLFAHKITHTGEKPFSCEYCNKSFRQKSDLIAHIRTHTGEKPFSCEHCNKCFGRSSALIAHIRTHTREKPFSCEHCNECFTQRNSLIVHIRTHTGEKPFSCEFCNKCFIQLSALKYHVRTHRGE